MTLSLEKQPADGLAKCPTGIQGLDEITGVQARRVALPTLLKLLPPAAAGRGSVRRGEGAAGTGPDTQGLSR